MKTSARNQFPGTVAAIQSGSVNDEIELEIAAGQRIVATVTRESRSALGLAVGTRAIALIKASSIVLVSDVGSYKFSARNQLAGDVAKVVRGSVNSEVTVATASGLTVVAMVTNESAQGLSLREGSSVIALFKAPSVILAVAA
jgi:molybdate transport system regulatory protein